MFCHDLQQVEDFDLLFYCWMYSPFCHDLQHFFHKELYFNLESTSRVHLMLLKLRASNCPIRKNLIISLYFYFLQCYALHCSLHLCIHHNEDILGFGIYNECCYVLRAGFCHIHYKSGWYTQGLCNSP